MISNFSIIFCVGAILLEAAHERIVIIADRRDVEQLLHHFTDGLFLALVCLFLAISQELFDKLLFCQIAEQLVRRAVVRRYRVVVDIQGNVAFAEQVSHKPFGVCLNEAIGSSCKALNDGLHGGFRMSGGVTADKVQHVAQGKLIYGSLRTQLDLLLCVVCLRICVMFASLMAASSNGAIIDRGNKLAECFGDAAL